MSIPKRNPDIFKNIIGYDYIKQEFLSILFALDNREEFMANGVTMPRGMLLYGDQTDVNDSLAGKFAMYSGYPCFLYDGKEDSLATFCDETKADRNYIVVITGFDKKVQNGDSELLCLLSSIMEDPDKNNIFFIATTKYTRDIPEEWRGPSRFFRRIRVRQQSYDEAIEMLHSLCVKKHLDESLENADFYGLLSNQSASEMEALIDDAIFHSTESWAGKYHLTIKDIIDAESRCSLKGDIYREKTSERQYQKTAFHEAGHVLACELLQQGITGYAIISDALHCRRRGIVGMRYSWNDYTDDIVASLAGKAAEEYIFEESSPGCSEDIENAFDCLLNPVLSGGVLGLSNVKFKSSFSAQSDALNESQEKAIYSLIEEYEQKAMKLISENHNTLNALASKLANQGYLLRSDIDQIMAYVRQEKKSFEKEVSIDLIKESWPEIQQFIHNRFDLPSGVYLALIEPMQPLRINTNYEGTLVLDVLVPQDGISTKSYIEWKYSSFLKEAVYEVAGVKYAINMIFHTDSLSVR